MNLWNPRTTREFHHAPPYFATVAAPCFASHIALGGRADDPLPTERLTGGRLTLALAKRFRCPAGPRRSLVDVDPAKIENLSTVSNSFRPYPVLNCVACCSKSSARDLKSPATAITSWSIPKDNVSTWAPRFEQLYRSFQQYFTARGWRPLEPKFPLIAGGVLHGAGVPSVRHARGQQNWRPYAGLLFAHFQPHIALRFHRRTNRDWSLNAETIIHEAAHQTAFNTGIHNRFAHPPRGWWKVWVRCSKPKACGIQPVLRARPTV